ncbi:MAG TPA: Dps family protein [Candidatus Krumholzibacteria bacterium]|nr:Dps family protein [Candidatus Krumholzibacteria bacterium]
MMNTATDPLQNQAVAEAAGKLLADSYTLYLKTHNYHWNVVGPMFNSLHLLFESQYTELAQAVDEIAERIRALGHHAPGSYAEFSQLSNMEEAQPNTSAQDMLRHLANDQRQLAASAMALLEVAEEKGDAATVDLATRRIETHQKNAWMLQSHLE